MIIFCRLVQRYSRWVRACLVRIFFFCVIAYSLNSITDFLKTRVYWNGMSWRFFNYPSCGQQSCIAVTDSRLTGIIQISLNFIGSIMIPLAGIQSHAGKGKGKTVMYCSVIRLVNRVIDWIVIFCPDAPRFYIRAGIGDPSGCDIRDIIFDSGWSKPWFPEQRMIFSKCYDC